MSPLITPFSLCRRMTPGRVCVCVLESGFFWLCREKQLVVGGLNKDCACSCPWRRMPFASGLICIFVCSAGMFAAATGLPFVFLTKASHFEGFWTYVTLSLAVSLFAFPSILLPFSFLLLFHCISFPCPSFLFQPSLWALACLFISLCSTLSFSFMVLVWQNWVYRGCRNGPQ